MTLLSPSGTGLFRLLPVLLWLVLAGCDPGNDYQAVLVLSDIAAGAEPTRLKAVTPAPSRSRVTIPRNGQGLAADLYLPGESPLAGVLLVPGAAEAGTEDPRLIAFATSLARGRFAVLVPDLPSLRALQVTPGNALELADAFSWLLGRPDLSPGGRAGMFAFSYAAGPALLAAMEEDLAEQVRFVFAVGGYHDLVEVLGFFTTGYFREEGRWRYREPNAYGKWVFVLSNLHRLADADDRRAFSAMARRRMRNLEAPIADLAEGLTAEGQALYAFITNGDPQRVPALLAALPPGMRRDVAALDLAGKDLSRLRAHLILVHGYDDDIIPYTESLSLAAALPQGQASLYLVDGLQHVDLQPGALSRYRLWRAIAELLAQRLAD